MDKELLPVSEDNAKSASVSVIIVNYNSGDFLKRCVLSVLEGNEAPIQVIVVDNASNDDSIRSVSELPIEVIRLKSNVGFAKANNIGVRKADGKYVLLLNPDTYCSPGAIDRMLELMEASPEYAAAGCQLLLPDGGIDPPCKRALPSITNAFFHLILGPVRRRKGTRILQGYSEVYPNNEGVYEVECISGAFMFIRTDVYNSLGGLDERFFMYGEDIDICYRMHRKGYKILYAGSIKVIHYRGQCSKVRVKQRLKRDPRTIDAFHRAMIIYYKKHLEQAHGRVMNSLVLGAIHLRRVLLVLVNRWGKA